MGKVVYLRAKEEKREVSPLLEGLLAWLHGKPDNTRNQYIRIAAEWIKFRGYEPESLSAQRAWVSARHVDAQKFVNEVRKRPAQPGRATEASGNGAVSMATVKHKVIVLKSIYDQLIAQGFVETNPFQRLNIELKHHAVGGRRPHVRIPGDAVKKLLGFKPKTREDHRDLAILHLFFGAALRRGEMCSLRIVDVKRSERGTTFLRLTQTKAQKIQEVALAEWVAEKVNAYLDMRLDEKAKPEDPLFAIYRKNGRESAFSSSTIYRLFKAYCKKFKLPDNFTPHCARVTAITQLLDQNVPHREVQELSRHASVQMVERYDRRRKNVDESASKKIKY